MHLLRTLIIGCALSACAHHKHESTASIAAAQARALADAEAKSRAEARAQAQAERDEDKRVWQEKLAMVAAKNEALRLAAIAQYRSKIPERLEAAKKAKVPEERIERWAARTEWMIEHAEAGTARIGDDPGDPEQMHRCELPTWELDEIVRKHREKVDQPLHYKALTTADYRKTMSDCYYRGQTAQTCRAWANGSNGDDVGVFLILACPKYYPEQKSIIMTPGAAGK